MINFQVFGLAHLTQMLAVEHVEQQAAFDKLRKLRAHLLPADKDFYLTNWGFICMKGYGKRSITNSFS
jgi:hypothetical protein